MSAPVVLVADGEALRPCGHPWAWHGLFGDPSVECCTACPGAALASQHDECGYAWAVHDNRRPFDCPGETEAVAAWGRP